MKMEIRVFEAYGNPTRSEYPLAEGWHYATRRFAGGMWGPWLSSREAYDDEEDALAAGRAAVDAAELRRAGYTVEVA